MTPPNPDRGHLTESRSLSLLEDARGPRAGVAPILSEPPYRVAEFEGA